MKAFPIAFGWGIPGILEHFVLLAKRRGRKNSSPNQFLIALINFSFLCAVIGEPTESSTLNYFGFSESYGIAVRDLVLISDLSRCSMEQSSLLLAFFFFAAVIQRNNVKAAPIKSDKFVVFLFAFSSQTFSFFPFSRKQPEASQRERKEVKEVVKHMKSRFSQVNGYFFLSVVLCSIKFVPTKKKRRKDSSRSAWAKSTKIFTELQKNTLGLANDDDGSKASRGTWCINWHKTIPFYHPSSGCDCIIFSIPLTSLGKKHSMFALSKRKILSHFEASFREQCEWQKTLLRVRYLDRASAFSEALFLISCARFSSWQTASFVFILQKRHACLASSTSFSFECCLRRSRKHLHNSYQQDEQEDCSRQSRCWRSDFACAAINSPSFK